MPEPAQHQAEEPEDLDRAGPVAHQELDRQEIEQDAYHAPQAVLRHAPAPRPVADRQLADGGAHPAAQGGQEAVHLPVQGHVLEDLAAVDLEGAPVVVEADPGDPRDQGVGDLRGEPPRPERILPVVAPAAHDVVALLELVDQPRDVRRVVLAVPVEGDDERAAGQVEAGRQRGGLAEVRAKLHDAERRQLDRELAEARARRVRRSVVDDDQLVRLPQALHDVPEAHEEGADVVLLVVDGDDDGEREAAHALLPPAVRSSPRVRLRALR